MVERQAFGDRSTELLIDIAMRRIPRSVWTANSSITMTPYIAHPPPAAVVSFDDLAPKSFFRSGFPTVFGTDTLGLQTV
jgi:hypothetical protein